MTKQAHPHKSRRINREKTVAQYHFCDLPIQVDRIGKMVTDAKRAYRKDPGHPDECFAFKYWLIFAPDETHQVRTECETATRGCRECKSALANRLNTSLKEIRERRAFYAEKPDLVWDILGTGTQKARQIAQQTLTEVREAMHLSFPNLTKAMRKSG